MEIKEMQMENIEQRMTEIETEMNADGADIEKLSAEVDALLERKNQIAAEAEEKRSLMNKVAGAKVEPVSVFDTVENGEKKMTINELRNSSGGRRLSLLFHAGKCHQSRSNRQIQSFERKEGVAIVIRSNVCREDEMSVTFHLFSNR